MVFKVVDFYTCRREIDDLRLTFSLSAGVERGITGRVCRKSDKIKPVYRLAPGAEPPFISSQIF